LLAAALALATPAAYAINIHADGRTEIRNSATGAASALVLDGSQSSACETVTRERSAGAQVAIDVDPAAPYGAFMRAANWLQDCGVARLSVALRTGDEAEAAPSVLLWQRLLPQPPPRRPSAPCPAYTGDVIVPCVALVVVTDDGAIWVVVGAREARRSSLGSLGEDARQAVATPGLESSRLFIRAGRTVLFGRYVEVLARLRAAGLTDLGLVNEEF
ncbi:MAG TPA: hypothetical protein VG939_16035, partial [Caulobacteraceae bacterium]|nr:hypothetical protein [Caulobacteraceae bacterium]